MATNQDLGRAILMKRMVSSLEQQGFRVELALDYGGYMVAGRGEDPPVYLLDADVIDKYRLEHPGDVREFLDHVVRHVKGQLGSRAHGAAGEGRPSGPPLIRAGASGARGCRRRRSSGREGQDRGRVH